MFQHVKTQTEFKKKQGELLAAIKETASVDKAIEAFNEALKYETVSANRAKLALVMLEVWASVPDPRLFEAAIGLTGINTVGQMTREKVLTSTMLTDASKIVLESKSITNKQLMDFYNQLTDTHKKTFLADAQQAGRSQEHYKFVLDVKGIGIMPSATVSDELKGFIKVSLEVDTLRYYIGTVNAVNKNNSKGNGKIGNKKNALLGVLFADLADKDIGDAIEQVNAIQNKITPKGDFSTVNRAIDTIIFKALDEPDNSKRNAMIGALADAAGQNPRIKNALAAKFHKEDLNDINKEAAEKLVANIELKDLLTADMKMDSQMYKAVVKAYMSGKGDLKDIVRYKNNFDYNIGHYVVDHYEDFESTEIAKLYQLLNNAQKKKIEEDLSFIKLTNVAKAVVSDPQGALSITDLLSAIDSRAGYMFNKAGFYKDLAAAAKDDFYLNRVVRHVLSMQPSLGKDAVKSIITPDMFLSISYENSRAYLELLVKSKDTSAAKDLMDVIVAKQAVAGFKIHDSMFFKDIIDIVKGNKELLVDVIGQGLALESDDFISVLMDGLKKDVAVGQAINGISADGSNRLLEVLVGSTVKAQYFFNEAFVQFRRGIDVNSVFAKQLMLKCMESRDRHLMEQIGAFKFGTQEKGVIDIMLAHKMFDKPMTEQKDLISFIVNNFSDEQRTELYSRMNTAQMANLINGVKHFDNAKDPLVNLDDLNIVAMLDAMLTKAGSFKGMLNVYENLDGITTGNLNKISKHMLDNIDKLGYKNVIGAIGGGANLLNLDVNICKQVITKMIEQGDFDRLRTAVNQVLSDSVIIQDKEPYLKHFADEMLKNAPSKIAGDDVVSVLEIYAKNNNQETLDLAYKVLSRGAREWDIKLLESALQSPKFSILNQQAQKKLCGLALQIDPSFFSKGLASPEHYKSAFQVIKDDPSVTYDITAKAAIVARQDDVATALGSLRFEFMQSEVITEMLNSKDKVLREKALIGAYNFVIREIVTKAEVHKDLKGITLQLLGEMNLKSEHLGLKTFKELMAVSQVLSALQDLTEEQQAVVPDHITKMMIATFNRMEIAEDSPIKGAVQLLSYLDIPGDSPIRDAVLKDPNVIKRVLLIANNSEHVAALVGVIGVDAVMQVYDGMLGSGIVAMDDELDAMMKDVDAVISSDDEQTRARSNIRSALLVAANRGVDISKLVKFLDNPDIANSVAKVMNDTFIGKLPVIYQAASPQGAANLAAAMVAQPDADKEAEIDAFLANLNPQTSFKAVQLFSGMLKLDDAKSLFDAARTHLGVAVEREDYEKASYYQTCFAAAADGIKAKENTFALTEVQNEDYLSGKGHLEAIGALGGDRLKVMEYIVGQLAREDVAPLEKAALEEYYAKKVQINDVNDQLTTQRINAVKELCGKSEVLEIISGMKTADVKPQGDKKIYVENMLMLDIASLVAIEKAYNKVHNGVEKGLIDKVMDFVNSCIAYLSGKQAEAEKGVQSFVDLMHDQGLALKVGQVGGEGNLAPREGEIALDTNKTFVKESLSHVEKLAKAGKPTHVERLKDADAQAQGSDGLGM